MTPETIIHTWTTKEFEHYEKGAGWYMTLAILGLMMIIYEIYLRDYFAAITVAVLVAAVYYFSKIMPRDVQVSITDRGLAIDKALFPYQELKRFWIVDLGATKQLHIETTAYLNRFIILLINDQDPEMIAGILKQYLPETEANKESVAQRLARHLRF